MALAKQKNYFDSTQMVLTLAGQGQYHYTVSIRSKDYVGAKN